MNATMPNFCFRTVDKNESIIFLVAISNVVHLSPSLPVASLIPSLTAFLGHIYNPDKAYQIGHEHSQLQFAYTCD
jgi:hypothetical protein